MRLGNVVKQKRMKSELEPTGEKKPGKLKAKESQNPKSWKAKGTAEHERGKQENIPQGKELQKLRHNWEQLPRRLHSMDRKD